MIESLLPRVVYEVLGALDCAAAGLLSEPPVFFRSKARRPAPRCKFSAAHMPRTRSTSCALLAKRTCITVATDLASNRILRGP